MAQAAGLTRIPTTSRWIRPRSWPTPSPRPTAPSSAPPSCGSGSRWACGAPAGRHPIVQLARLVGAVPVIAVDIDPGSATGPSNSAPTRRSTPGTTDCGPRSPRSPEAGCSTSPSTRSGSVTFEQAFDCPRRRPPGRRGDERRGATSDRPSVRGVAKQVRGHLGYKNVDIETLASWCPAGGWTSRARSARSCRSRTSAWASRSWSAGGRPDQDPGQALRTASANLAPPGNDQREVEIGGDPRLGRAHRGDGVHTVRGGTDDAVLRAYAADLGLEALDRQR